MPRPRKADQEDYICKLVFNEYTTAKSNQQEDFAEFEQITDLLECVRSDKNYDWMSNVFFPEYPSILLTEASQWANQYFQSRDFVDVYLEGTTKEDEAKSRAAKKLINAMLNDKGIYYYHKYMKARLINSIGGVVYALCWWEQDIKQTTTQKPQVDYSYDEQGNAVPQVSLVDVPKDEILTDRFNFEVYDPRNVFTDNSVVYSIQDKKWIIFRCEKTLEELKAESAAMGYINLDRIGKPAQETETSRETYNKDVQQQKITQTSQGPFDVLYRLGKMWAVVKGRDEQGNPSEIEYGYNDRGEKREGAEYIETVSTFVLSGDTKTLIQFAPQRYTTKKGKVYRPVLRGLCYIHPTKDTGMSDGKYSRELQVALNDTINMSNDRVQLATFPTLQVKSSTLEDNTSIYFEPEHPMIVQNIGDVQEFKIQDNVDGALRQFGLFKGGMQEVTSIYPTTMGDIPKASTTATAVAGAESRTNLRANYKSLTWEYTFECEKYWMIQQMAYQYMRQETAFKVLGEDVYAFDPDGEYTYQPVSSNVEQTASKEKKISQWQQIMNTVIGIKHPDAVKMINYIFSEICKNMGQEFQVFAKSMLDPKTPIQEGPEGGKDMQGDPTSNQNGYPMSAQEQSVRGMV